MKKKIMFSIVTMICMILISVPASYAKFSDVPADAGYADAVERLSGLKIMNGYTDGRFYPDEIVTREQFATIMVAASGLSDDAKIRTGSTIFPDVAADRWSSGFINVAVNKGFMLGMPDGSFYPTRPITLGQASTVMIRLLGYTDDDLPGLWPGNYVRKARQEGILEGINLEDNDYTSRWAIALMVDRLLSTNVKKMSQNGAEESFAQHSGLGTVKEQIIVSTPGLDASLPSGRIKTDAGEYSITGLNLDKYIGQKAKLLFDSNNRVVGVVGVSNKYASFIVSSAVENGVSYLENGKLNNTSVPSDTVIYFNGSKSTFKNIVNSSEDEEGIIPGSVMVLAYSSENSSLLEYGVVITPDMSKPTVALKDVSPSDSSIGSIDISNKENIIVYKNREKAKLTDIKAYDVVYYMQSPFDSTKILFVYDEKTTGTYDEAFPSKTNVNSIKVAGKLFNIVSLSAANKLTEGIGAFKTGDQVTLLKGRNDGVVDVIAPYSSDVSNLAVVVNTRSAISDDPDTPGKQIYYVKLFMVNGETMELEASQDYSKKKGKLVKYDVENKKAVISDVGRTSGVYGEIDEYDKKIGDTWIIADATLIDIISDNNNQDTVVRKIEWGDIPSGYISENKIIYAVRTGDFRDVQLIVFDNVTNGEGEYGFLAKKEPLGSDGYRYELLTGKNKINSSNPDANFAASVGSIVNYTLNGNTIETMKTVSPDLSGKVQAVDSRRIMIKDKVYKMADDVLIYRIYNNDNVVMLSVDDIKEYKDRLVSIYCSSGPSDKRKVKAITIR